MIGARAVAGLARDAELGDRGIRALRAEREVRARVSSVTADAGVVPERRLRRFLGRRGDERGEPRDPPVLAAQPDQRKRPDQAARPARDPVDLHVVRAGGLLELHGLGGSGAVVRRSDLGEESAVALE
jgi:hypothetical protein